MTTTPVLTVIPGGKYRAANSRVLTTGVNVVDNRYIPTGAIITTQAAANRLPYTSTRIYLKAQLSGSTYL